jgi:hypothetical protein
VSRTFSLAVGETESGSVSAPGETHEYSIPVSSGDVLFLRCVGAGGDPGFSPTASVHGPDGAVKAEGIGNDGKVWVADGTGTCSVRVADDRAGRETGSYALYVQRLSRPENARAASIGSATQGSISTAGEVAAYTIAAGAGDRFVIGTTKVSGDLWPGFSILSAGGEVVITEKSPAQAMVTVLLPTAGTYTLLVQDGFRGTNTGTYALYLQRISRPVGATTLPRARLTQGRVANPGDLVSYSFDGTAGEEMRFQAEKVDGELWPMVWLFSPSGEELAKEYDSRTCTVTRRLDTGGAYTLLVGNGFGGDAFTGSFAVSAGTAGSPTLTYVAVATTSARAGTTTALASGEAGSTGGSDGEPVGALGLFGVLAFLISAMLVVGVIATVKHGRASAPGDLVPSAPVPGPRPGLVPEDGDPGTGAANGPAAATEAAEENPPAHVPEER